MDVEYTEIVSINHKWSVSIAVLILLVALLLFLGRLSLQDEIHLQRPSQGAELLFRFYSCFSPAIMPRLYYKACVIQRLSMTSAAVFPLSYVEVPPSAKDLLKRCIGVLD